MVEGICGVVGEAGFEEEVPDHIFAMFLDCGLWRRGGGEGA